MPRFLTAVEVDQIPAACNVEQQAAWVARVWVVDMPEDLLFLQAIHSFSELAINPLDKTNRSGLRRIGNADNEECIYHHIITYLYALFGFIHKRQFSIL